MSDGLRAVIDGVVGGGVSLTAAGMYFGVRAALQKRRMRRELELRAAYADGVFDEVKRSVSRLASRESRAPLEPRKGE